MQKDNLDPQLSISFIKHSFHQINLNKSPIRIFHNYLLKEIEIHGKTIDLGSGTHSSYHNFLNKKKIELFFADKFHSKEKNFYKIDLENSLKLDDHSFDTVLLFNVLEHVRNHKNLINEIYRILKPGGKFEIFVPFMHRYHEDPLDVFRPTHRYLEDLLKSNDFKVKTSLVGVGPFVVISEILLRYFRFKFLKKFLFLIFLLLNKFSKFFSKDYQTYYLGIHCSCRK